MVLLKTDNYLYFICLEEQKKHVIFLSAEHDSGVSLA